MTSPSTTDFFERITSELQHALPAMYSGRLPIVLLTEGEDARVQSAAVSLAKLGVARVNLLFERSEDVADAVEGCEVILPSESPLRSEIANGIYTLRQSKGCSEDQAEQLSREPLPFAAMALRSGGVDCVVSGARHTTADVFKAGLQFVGIEKGSSTASSFFLMVLRDGRVVTYADCAIVPEPNPRQLADIAIAAARNHQALVGEVPRVALLSFSTKGSAEHARVSAVRETLEIIKSSEPTLIVDGELQFDAAIDFGVAARKSPGSEVGGKANVFVFPNLDAGNIAYKITERLAGAKAIGPIIQGLNKPWMDLSRGCSSEDIVGVALIALKILSAKGR